MPLVTCPICQDDDPLGVDRLLDGRLVVRCLACDHEWVRGEAQARPVVTAAPSFEQLKDTFPSASGVRADVLARVKDVTAEFFALRPQTDPEVVPYWAKYPAIFSAEGLPEADPADLKAFANSSVGAHPGNMSVFNSALNDLGDDRAATRLRETIDYLLRGPEGTHLEDRFTDLVEGRRSLGMTGFKESLLTRVLCVVEPDRFLPLLKYTTPSGGKKEVALWVYGLDLPQREKVAWTIGRLVTWSNDLLVGMLRDDFGDLQHASQFLWWAKDRKPGVQP
jgi:hypothetical protein